MPIPPLNEIGVLPPGTHACTIGEVQERFGVFKGSDRRIVLTARLFEYFVAASAANVGSCLYVDGSYVTAKPEPDDIDLLLILREDVELDATVPPFEYNARSRGYVKKKFGFDFYFGFENDASSERMLATFRRVKGVPGAEKGLLRLDL